MSYRVSAKENYIKGKKAFDDEDYLEAIEYFKFVKNKFPYSAYATQSDLLIADCHYAREHFLEAADAYADFIKLHPRHEKVAYAMYRIGLCFFERIPEDWWFAPPAYELDQRETDRAIVELERYLARFPEHENAADARTKLERCKRRNAEKVRYIMEFNRKGDHFQGALWRAEQLLALYPGSFDQQALFYKAEALVALDRHAEALEAVTELLSRFPTGRYAEDARELKRRIPQTAKAPKRPEQAPQPQAGKASGAPP